MSQDHIFKNHCIDFAQILSHSTLDKMLKVVYTQSKTEEAKIRADFVNYKDYGSDQWCPAYFGMFTEWLAQHFLNHYGRIWNVQGVRMTDSIGSTAEDYGVDGQGLSIMRKVYKSTGRIADANSPVYIQVKGTMNPTKEYSPNDGARLPNFGCNAFATAIRSGYAYQGRYILFTTGKGIKYTMNNMFMGMVEVINRNHIEKLMDDDTVFLNKLRVSVGLDPIDVVPSHVDHQFALMQDIIKKDVDNV